MDYRIEWETYVVDKYGQVIENPSRWGEKQFVRKRYFGGRYHYLGRNGMEVYDSV